MHHPWLIGAVAFLFAVPPLASGEEPTALPEAAEGWKIALAVEAPRILFPTAIATAPDGTVYLGQDPMDMPGPPTQPIDSVVAIKNGQVKTFADKLWSVMGLEWVEGTLFVVHAPFLSAFRDTNGDGQADERVDLITGLGPRLPGFSGINDHVPSGIRLGIDGYLYIAVGDKGIPKGVGKDGTTIQLFGGGVIRIRPDGTGLEVVSTGERNPLSVALTATDDILTYGNDDDSKRWPNSLTHHIVGGHYGYPYQFLLAPHRALPIVAGEIGGSGAQGVSYNEDALPDSYRGNFFFCDWGLSTVFRYELEPSGGTFKVKRKTPFVSKGNLSSFRPFSMGVSADGASLWLVDWAYDGWLADGPRTGRLYQLTYEGDDLPKPTPRPAGDDPAERIKALDHPALAVRRESQRVLARTGESQVQPLVARLEQAEPSTGRIHAIWALDAIGTEKARTAIGAALTDPDPLVREQAARSVGIRRERSRRAPLETLLKDPEPTVRREAAIALGRLNDPQAGPALMAALGDADVFVAWSIRHAIKSLKAWNEAELTTALLDEKRQEDALKLADESWALPVVLALVKALPESRSESFRTRLVAALGGLYRKYPAWSGQWFGTNPLAGRLPRTTEAWDRTAMAHVLRGLAIASADADQGVRSEAIAALSSVGSEAAPYLRSRLTRETEPKLLAQITEGLASLNDVHSSSLLSAMAQDAQRPEAVRGAALDALSKLGGPEVLRARLTFVFDPKAPPSLVARALTALGQDGVLPANDVAGFLESPSPEVRRAALLAFNPKRKIGSDLVLSLTDRLNDQDEGVRRTAIEVVASLGLREAIPRLLALSNEGSVRHEAIQALAKLPSPQALPVYLAGLDDRSPAIRSASEGALLAIREQVRPDLEQRVRSQGLSNPARLALERVLARFQPLENWKVIGPFARTTAKVFVGERTIDFSKTHSGVEGRTIAWAEQKAEAQTGRVVLNDFKAGAGDRGGFGYDVNGSPDLCAFGYTEISSAEDRVALFLVGSSGRITLTVNEQVVLNESPGQGRAYSPDSNLVRVKLSKGVNRILAVSRQGIGVWSFSVQVSEPSSLSNPVATQPKANALERLRAFANDHEGDAKKGEELFFDAKGMGCARCHSAGGKGTASAGPDLTGLALKYDKAEIIRSVLEPSSRIATGYQPVLISMKDGKVITGLVRSESETEIELVDQDLKVTRIAKSQVEERRIGDVSLMPTNLVETLTPIEFADLISYLQSLKAAPSSTPAEAGSR